MSQVDELNFSGIKLGEDKDKKYIVFTLNNHFTYIMWLKKDAKTGTWEPEEVSHNPYPKHYDSICDLCHYPIMEKRYVFRSTTVCDHLNHHKKEVYEKIRKMPTARIKMITEGIVKGDKIEDIK